MSRLPPFPGVPYLALTRGSGGIGRRAGLRIQWGNPWGFESPLSHLITVLSRTAARSTMRLLHPLLLRARRGLLVYQLVLILIVVVILIVALLFYARRNQASMDVTPPAPPSDTAAAVHRAQRHPLTAFAVRAKS